MGPITVLKTVLIITVLTKCVANPSQKHRRMNAGEASDETLGNVQFGQVSGRTISPLLSSPLLSSPLLSSPLHSPPLTSHLSPLSPLLTSPHLFHSPQWETAYHWVGWFKDCSVDGDMHQKYGDEDERRRLRSVRSCPIIAFSPSL